MHPDMRGAYLRINVHWLPLSCREIFENGFKRKKRQRETGFLACRESLPFELTSSLILNETWPAHAHPTGIYPPRSLPFKAITGGGGSAFPASETHSGVFIDDLKSDDGANERRRALRKTRLPGVTSSPGKLITIDWNSWRPPGGDYIFKSVRARVCIPMKSSHLPAPQTSLFSMQEPASVWLHHN